MDLSVPRVMGILNVTPDSFFDGGKFDDESVLLQHTATMLAEGADIIDVGGYSTRPGAEDVPEPVERQRVVTAIRAIIRNFPEAVLSVDTFRGTVAHAAVQEGAALVNDVSGGELDPTMFRTVAQLRVPYILMHMRGNPKTMSGLTDYQNVLLEVLDYFQKKIHHLNQHGVHDIITDPGFGFAKTPDQSFELLNHLEKLKILQLPLLVGLSRKSMIWKTLNRSPEGALNGTTALHMAALLHGASLLRVHDVKEAKEVITLFNRIKRPPGPSENTR